MSHLCQKATFFNFMVMDIIKLENEGTFIREQWKEKFRGRSEQDWSKVC